MTKKILVCGAGGFIGSHLVDSLKNQGHTVVAADLKLPEFKHSTADVFYQLDLRNQNIVNELITPDIDEVYQLAAEMGGAGYIFTGSNDSDIMNSSAAININVINSMKNSGVRNVFFTSSACVYPQHNQQDRCNILTAEHSAYPADPDSEYGWEKLFAERLYQAAAKNYGFNVKIARLHNVYGPECTWRGGREKAPAALCRKIAEADTKIENWGDGKQIRSFMYIDQCIEGIHRLQNSKCSMPINLGCERTISINDLALLIAKIAGKTITIKNIPGPLGVAARTSDNTVIKQLLNWEPIDNLEYGLKKTYDWITNQMKGNM
jgi:nucleoside-diphosphate-sugar epimerase